MALVVKTHRIHVSRHPNYIVRHTHTCRYTAATYLINEAASRQLLRLRKDELVRLYQLAGLTEEAELLTKQEIVEAIMAARDEVAPLPPSSPPGPMDSGSSDYSSDGGNVAGGEETDIGYRLRNGMKRRATMHDISRSVPQLGQERCYSLGELDGQRLRTRMPPQRKGSLQLSRRWVAIVNPLIKGAHHYCSHVGAA